VFTNAILW